MVFGCQAFTQNCYVNAHANTINERVIKRYGKSFSQLKEESGGEEAWMESLPETHALGEVVKGNGGPLIMGTES